MWKWRVIESFIQWIAPAWWFAWEATDLGKCNKWWVNRVNVIYIYRVFTESTSTLFANFRGQGASFDKIFEVSGDLFFKTFHGYKMDFYALDTLFLNRAWHNILASFDLSILLSLKSGLPLNQVATFSKYCQHWGFDCIFKTFRMHFQLDICLHCVWFWLESYSDSLRILRCSLSGINIKHNISYTDIP